MFVGLAEFGLELEQAVEHEKVVEWRAKSLHNGYI